MKMSSWYHKLLIYDVKRTTKLDGMGPFKRSMYQYAKHKIYKSNIMLLTVNYYNDKIITPDSKSNIFKKQHIFVGF